MALDTARVATDTVDAHLSDHNTLHKKANGYVDAVADYSATGDGTTDDTTAIQNALDAAAGSGEVFLPAGTYSFTGLTIQSGTTLRGAGMNATKLVLAASADSDGIRTTNTDPDTDDPDTDIVIRDLELDGNRLNQTVGGGGLWSSPHGPVDSFTAGIRIVNGSRVLIENVYAHDWTGYGVEIKATTKSVVRGCWFENAGDDGISVSDGGLSGSSYSEDIIVSDCLSWGNGHDNAGSGSGFEVDDGPKWVSFVNCHAFDTEVGFDVHTHDDYSAPQYILIADCLVHDTTSNGIVLASGPITGGTGDELTRLTDIWIRDTVLADVGGGLSLQGTTPAAKRLSIQNVSVFNSGALGIRLSGATESVVEGCYVNGTEDHGILLQDTASDNRIVNCMVIDAGDGAATFKRGIQITSGSDDNFVMGCTTRIVNASNMQFGFRINASDCDNNVVVGNDFRGGGYSDAGTGTVTAWPSGSAGANFT